MAERGNAFRVLMGKPEEKRCKGNIKVDLAETPWKGMDWIRLVQVRGEWRLDMNTVLNCRIPYNSAPWGCLVS
jgi:hypothetical protein